MPEQAERIQEARAILRGYRATPRKARQVVDLIRGKGVEEARAILKFTPRHAARTVEKLLRSAVANAAQKAMTQIATEIRSTWMSGKRPIINRR